MRRPRSLTRAIDCYLQGDLLTMKTDTPIRSDSALAAEFWEKGKSESCPIYDMHGHMGPFHSIYFPRCQPEAMAHSMDIAGVKLLCFAHHASLFVPELGNRPAIEAVLAFPDHFRAYVSINPHYPETIRKDIADYGRNSEVFVGLKFLADYHQVPISDDRYREALEFAQERSLPILIHTWRGSPCDGPEQVRKIAERYSKPKFLLAHSLCDDWDAATQLVKDFPNIYLELTAVVARRGVIPYFVQRIGSERLFFGTDLPWFDEHFYIGAVLSADITDDDRHNIFHRNAQKLLGL